MNDTDLRLLDGIFQLALAGNLDVVVRHVERYIARWPYMNELIR